MRKPVAGTAAAAALAFGLTVIGPAWIVLKPGQQAMAAAAISGLSADTEAVPTPRPRPYAGTPRARPYEVATSLPLPRPTNVALSVPTARPLDRLALMPRPAPRGGEVELAVARPPPQNLAEPPAKAPPAAGDPQVLSPDPSNARAGVAPQDQAVDLAQITPGAGTTAVEPLGLLVSNPPAVSAAGAAERSAVAVAMALSPMPLAAPRPARLGGATWPDPLGNGQPDAAPPPPRPRPASLLPALMVQPAAVESDPADSLNILSEEDAALYARAFDLQAEGNWDAADRVIRRIDDPLLMGHLREQRLMHPRDYRASFAELQRWMRSYADHPEADRVYRLAQQRRPAGAALTQPKAPDLRVLDAALEDRAADIAGKPAAAPRAKGGSVRRGGLNGVRGAYYSGDWPKALVVAQRLSEAHGARLPGAAWYAGLSAWRLQRYDLAARSFAALAGYATASPWEQSAGGYWAARAYLTLGRPAAAIQALQDAAAHSRTFYGLLAARRLGLDPVFGWTKLSDDESLVDALFEVGAVRRALALAQTGQSERARAELRQLMEARRRAGDDVFLPMLTALMGLTGDAQTAYRMAQLWQAQTGEHIDPAMFPEPHWQPEGGFTFDRALIYAFIRKESRFDPVARSPAGARGLMQLMPATARFVNGGGQNLSRILNDPAGNLQLGQLYIRHLERDVGLGSDLIRIAIAYNAGPGNLDKWDRQAEHGGDPLLLIESLPSAETRDFVERILANLWVYRARLGQPSPSLDDLARGAWPRYVPLDESSDSEGNGTNG